jgi:hypothetical protein
MERDWTLCMDWAPHLYQEDSGLGAELDTVLRLGIGAGEGSGYGAGGSGLLTLSGGSGLGTVARSSGLGIIAGSLEQAQDVPDWGGALEA